MSKSALFFCYLARHFEIQHEPYTSVPNPGWGWAGPSSMNSTGEIA